MTDEELKDRISMVLKDSMLQHGFEIICKENVELKNQVSAISKALVLNVPQWHDLRKNQNDLPDNSRYVWTNVGAGYHDDDGWWDDFGRLQNVVAWCEPKF